MSLPQELLDQLLNGYLDDALTADERDRVDRLLQSDPDVAKELEQLRDLRRSLQALSRFDSDIKLDNGFADRVLGAAVARAREEGLADDHPLVRLSEQPSTATPDPARTQWRVAAAMVALAASIVAAVFVLRPSNEVDPGLVAQADPNPTEVITEPEVDPALPKIDEGTMLADSGQPSEDQIASTDAVADGTPDVVESRPVETVSPEPVAPNTIPENSDSVESIAASDPSAMDTEADSLVPGDGAPKTRIGAILVVDVQRTDAGRATEAVAKALAAADIQPASRKEVTAEIEGFVAGNVPETEKEVSVLFLQLPARKFDLFYRQLWADEAGVASVRMTIALDAPFVNVLNEVRADPTSVQHSPAAMELFSQTGVVEQMAQELSELPFPQGERSNPEGARMVGTGPDVPAQVLVLVR